MIKEIAFKATAENEYLYPSVAIDVAMDQPFKQKIETLNHVNYFHEHLSGKTINLVCDITEGDWIPVSRWSELVCISKRFKDVFEDKLKGYWYHTNNANYFIFLLDNCIDALDEENGTLINRKKYPYWYESIEGEVFKDEVERNEYLFTLKIEPTRDLSTDKFEKLYREHGFTGIQFFKDINFKRASGRFDGARFYKYDDEGNCMKSSGGLK